jgi:signal transduction histidine kinase
MEPAGSGEAATRIDVSNPPPQVGPLAELLPDGLLVVDHHGVVRFISNRAAHLVDESPEALMGRPVREVFPLHDNEGRSWWDLADPWHTLHTVTGHREKLLFTRNGLELLITAKYLRSEPRGPVRRVLMSLRDASARQRAEQDHAALISTIAHELRSPLTSVKGFSATLLRGWEKFTDDQKRFMIETMETDADRVSRLITELLDVSRLDAGRLDVRLQPVDLPAMVHRHVERMRAGGLPGERFSVETDEDLPEVWADPDRVNQILANLLENAVRHGDGTVTVGIMTDGPNGSNGANGQIPSPRSGDDPAVLVSVADEGDGVPEEHLPLVFNRFWHGQRRGSSGLGLYIVRGLVEAHGGRITVGRAPSGGADFRFTLPSGAPEYVL